MAARRLMVGSLSRPVKIGLLQRPQRSPGMNPSFLPIPNPKPLRPNPVRYLGFGFPPTISRPFSTEAEYRRRLGIGDSPIGFFEPPKEGQIKINFTAVLAEDHYDDDGDGDDEGCYAPSCTGGIRAVARNSSGDVIGVTAGTMEYTRGYKLELQLYALKAAGNLAKELKSAGMHDGPVVYVPVFHSMVALVLHDDCDGGPEEVLRCFMPPDEYLEEVGRSCRVYCGTKDKLKEIMPDDLFDRLFDLLEKENALFDRAGLT